MAGGDQPPIPAKDYPLIFLEITGLIAFSGLLYWYGNWKTQKKSEKVEEVLKELAPLDSEWDEKHLKAMAEKSFMKIQEAWCVQDLPKLKALLAPEIYAKWESDIKFYQKMGQKDYMENLKVQNISIVEIENYLNRDRDKFAACIDAGAVDYFTDDKGRYFNNDDSTKPLTSRDGLRFQTFREYWTFQRIGVRQWILFRVDQQSDWGQTVDEPVINEETTRQN